jgi:hypothetical protein
MPANGDRGERNKTGQPRSRRSRRGSPGLPAIMDSHADWVGRLSCWQATVAGPGDMADHDLDARWMRVGGIVFRLTATRRGIEVSICRLTVLTCCKIIATHQVVNLGSGTTNSKHPRGLFKGSCAAHDLQR